MEPSRDTAKPDFIAALTGLRGYAALWVALSHFSFTDTLWQSFGARIHWGIAEGILKHEYLAVDLFFMLSGFVLMHVHGQEFTDRISFRTQKQFLLLRLARIYPLHLFALLLMLPLQLVDTGIDGLRTPFSFVTQLLLVASWGMNWQLSWNLPSWSLSSEWLGYLLFPFFALAANRIQHKFLHLALVASFFGLFYWLMFHLPLHLNYSNGTGASVRILCGMSIGILLHKLHDTPLIRPATWTALFWLCIPLATATMTDARGTRLHENIWAILMMAALLLTASRAQGRMMMMLTHRAAIYLGEISFAIYILHYPLFRFFRWLGNGLYSSVADGGTTLDVLILAAVTIILLLALSALAHHCIEKPVRQWAQLRIQQMVG